MSKKNKSQNKKIQSWEAHLSGAKEKEFYSIQRIDILIISISGACIYIVLETLKFLNTPEIMKLNMNSCTILLKMSAISSVIAIGVNFISQISGFKANQYEVKYSREVINQAEEGIEDDNKLNSIDRKSRFYDDLTSAMNITASLFMGIGIICLVVYNIITF